MLKLLRLFLGCVLFIIGLDKLLLKFFVLIMFAIDYCLEFSNHILLLEEMVVKFLNLQLVHTHYLFLLSLPYLHSLLQTLDLVVLLSQLGLQFFNLVQVNLYTYFQLLDLYLPILSLLLPLTIDLNAAIKFLPHFFLALLTEHQLFSEPPDFLVHFLGLFQPLFPFLLNAFAIDGLSFSFLF